MSDASFKPRFDDPIKSFDTIEEIAAREGGPGGRGMNFDKPTSLRRHLFLRKIGLRREKGGWGGGGGGRRGIR